ncbi:MULTISPECIES: LLM class F420-dependent oxidoreductase [unclassified Streptomyces]|uniref:LLM class F420-dependent oxidoreductase n=1 Tax=unclassified Streptomyces TaxID=2593676 RepID=UPI0016603EF2|nr:MULTISPECIES: LLM class F420-dependent oxidoreductase [unclassified Streptomyces]MBD0707934.1 LLM class F420-dependent oxidoreductase [Streptomyces sp. CBMA291]MBD0715972.1 LLM class F420-dependent oxidoreductase [Streptomyces sp. CBMA370]
MRLGLALGYWGRGPSPTALDLTREAERLGYDSVWTAEAWGSDAFTTLTWLAAHTSRIRLGTAVAQMAARAPTTTAMHALTLDHLSGGRVLLGLGLSGPQVVEGWYGRPFPRSPLTATREYVDVVRQVLRREGPVRLEGRHHPHPYTGPDGTGLGKPLKPITHPLRADLPVLLGAEGPGNIAQTLALADGWLPLYWTPDRWSEVYALPETLPAGFLVAPLVRARLCADVAEGLLPVKAMLGFYIGGMGHARRNFHADLMGRMGYGKEAGRVRELFAAGRREEAVAAVPDAFADEISLTGPRKRIAARLDRWRQGPVTDLLVTAPDPDTLRLLAELNA